MQTITLDLSKMNMAGKQVYVAQTIKVWHDGKLITLPKDFEGIVESRVEGSEHLYVVNFRTYDKVALSIKELYIVAHVIPQIQLMLQYIQEAKVAKTLAHLNDDEVYELLRKDISAQYDEFIKDGTVIGEGTIRHQIISYTIEKGF